MNTIRISSIEELIHTFNSHTNSWVFRGQANAGWQIESSLERLIGGKWSAATAKKYEEWSYDEFKSRFHLYDQENRTPTSKLAWLSAMQHYGVSTRLLRKMNINSKTLYGDLAGLGQHIRMSMQAYT